MSAIRHFLDGLPPSVSPSSHAVEVDGLVYLTGQFGRDLARPGAPLPDGIRAQTARTLENLSTVLGRLGLDLRHVVSMRVYLRRFDEDYAAMNEVYAGFFPEGGRPVRTCIGVAGLVRGALIEVEAVAHRRAG